MRVKPLVGLAVGPTDSNHWGQVLMQPAGYGIVEIESQDGRAAEIGAHLLSQLGSVVSEGVTSLRALEKAVDPFVSQVVKSLIVFVPVGKVLYVVFRGEGVVYLSRGSQIAVLMKQEGAISGEIREKDVMIVASRGFSRLLPLGHIGTFFDHEPPATIAEKLTIALHEKENGEGSAALVYSVEQFEDYEEALVKEPVALPKPRFAVKMPNINMRKVIPIVLMVFFVLSVILGILKQNSQVMSRDMELAYTNAQHAFEEGTALFALNPVKGRERLLQAKEFLDPVASQVNARSAAGRKVSELYRLIQDNLTQSLQISRVVPELFYDMTLMKKEAVASSFATEGRILIVSDMVNATVYRLDISSKKASIIGGGETVVGLSAVSLHGDAIYALTSSGIVEFWAGEKKSTLIVKPDVEWGVIGSMVAFGGNIYLLDTQKNRIWKYVSVANAQALNAESIAATDSATVSTKTGFSALREYLNPDTLPDFSQSTNMTIDGTVWVGSRTGHIFHFVQGREEPFLPKGVEPPLGSDTHVFATDETINVYVLDKQNNRVVVLDKEGTYLSQYQWSDFLPVSAFVVSEEQKKILLLSQGKIYSIDLK